MSSFARDLPIVAQPPCFEPQCLSPPGGPSEQHLWAPAIPREAHPEVHLPLAAEATLATARRRTGEEIFPLR